MVSSTVSALTLGLATIGGASAPTAPAPAAPTTTTPSSNPPQTFPLFLQAEDIPTLPLYAIKSEAIGNYYLTFQRPSVYTGTPAYLVDSELAFLIPGEDTPYAMNFGDSIRGPGDLNDVEAGYGFNQAVSGLAFSDDGVLVFSSGTSPNFFACNTTLNAMEEFSLKIGQANADGSAPEGCVAAKIRKPTSA
ncbi:hypothetical protein BKA65DRAFT_488993 [Rhexocercosporidium sp. MPI-PUGE-AT-0058]|nr:hypothetical protein BKA65DRAFT_488993 [Rhexocercosporidium sp. MPI-PUGE-AT-0058]